MDNNDLPHDAVERVREIRRRHHEETKHMTVEEMWAHDQKDYDAFKALLANAKPDYERFPFLAKK
jgi:hypothetical protein